MYKIDELHDLLRVNGYKLTSVRKNVYCALVDADQPLSNSELILRLKDVDKVSVYRTVTLFEQIGIVNRIWTGFKSKIELGEVFSPHHHHFSCSECKKILTFKSSTIEQELENLQRTMGIVIAQHHIELSGQCVDCSAPTEDGQI